MIDVVFGPLIVGANDPSFASASGFKKSCAWIISHCGGLTICVERSRHLGRTRPQFLIHALAATKGVEI